MGLLPSANFSQKSAGVYVLNGPMYNICEVYIDDMLVFGDDNDASIRNIQTVFQLCREKNVTFNEKTIVMEFDTAPVVSNELSAMSINMSTKRK